jgi:hypothetical protein
MRYTAIAIVLVIAFWLQMLLALPKLSATSDEIVHLPAGYTYWTTRDFRLNPEHPPLVKLVAALPLLFLKPHVDMNSREWTTGDEYFFGYHFLYRNDADRLLFWGRLPMTLIASLGAILVFLWARDMFGPAAGLFALGLCAFSPNLLAHGMLVTTDVPVAVFATLAAYLFWKSGLKGNLAVGLATGAAMASKFSAAILPVIIVGFSIWRVCCADERRKQAIVEARQLTVAAIGCIFIIEAAYLFSAPVWVYLTNMRYLNANHNPIRMFYLFGNFSRSGWWYYFLLAFLVKATVPFLLTIVLAAIQLAVKRFINLGGEVLVLALAISFLAVVMVGADDMGVRYLLPVFPLLFIWGSRIVVELRQRAAGIALLVLLVAWQARAALGAFPNYIPYFNEIAGGASAGVQYLDDSNVDWGQAIKMAGEYVRSHKMDNVELLPFSTFDNPHYYGIQRPLRNDLDTYQVMISEQHHPGVYIVSSHHLIRVMRVRPEWDPRNAIDRIGDSMWVYRF